MKYHFDESKKEAISGEYSEIKQKFGETKDKVTKEDEVRGLFTMEPTRTDIIKYPTFAGLPSEDFLKFKETMMTRFKENKVKKKEQVSKLRECLKGAALGRVPDGIQEI